MTNFVLWTLYPPNIDNTQDALWENQLQAMLWLRWLGPPFLWVLTATDHAAAEPVFP